MAMDQLQIRIPRIDDQSQAQAQAPPAPPANGNSTEEEQAMDIDVDNVEQPQPGIPSSSPDSGPVSQPQHRPIPPLRPICLFVQEFFKQNYQQPGPGEEVKGQTKVRDTFTQACKQWSQLTPEAKSKYVNASRQHWDEYSKSLQAWKNANKQLKRPPTPYALFVRDMWKGEHKQRSLGKKPRTFVQLSQRASEIWGLQKPYKRRYQEERKEYIDKMRKLSEEKLQENVPTAEAETPQNQDVAPAHDGDEHDQDEAQTEDEEGHDKNYDSAESASEWDDDDEHDFDDEESLSSYASDSESEYTQMDSDSELEFAEEDWEEEEEEVVEKTKTPSKSKNSSKSKAGLTKGKGSVSQLYPKPSANVGPSKESVEDIDYKADVISKPGMESYNEGLDSSSTDSNLGGSQSQDGSSSDMLQVPSSVFNKLVAEMPSEEMDQDDEDDSQMNLGDLKAPEEEEEEDGEEGQEEQAEE